MLFDTLVKLTDFWEAGQISENPKLPYLKNREISGHLFQFQVLDYRSRTKMGLRLSGVVSKFSGIGEPLLKISKLKSEEEQKKSLVVEIMPAILDKMSDPDFYDFVDELCGMASVSDGTEFKKLSGIEVAEPLFKEDLTLQIPVAMTVLEVNLSDGFFDRLAEKFN